VSDCWTERLDECLPAHPHSIALLRHAVTGLAVAGGASQRQCEDIALGVSEAVSNVVRHAYVGRDRAGAVALEATIVDGSLIVVISDDGRGMSATGNRGAMGLGLHLIESVAERCELQDSKPVGVRLRMSFAID
jgi:anti-sigma regulatory factor (Ser/Thr protein kinase)